jgi:hypothetical protein
VSLSADPLTLLETADLLGRYRYVELLAHHRIGLRAGQCTDASICVYLESASAAHGFRAELFEARLPVSVGLPGISECTRSPHRSVDVAFDLLVASETDSDVVAVLLGEVYPAMAGALKSHLVMMSPYCDPPIRRAVRRALADLLEVCAEGESLRLAGQQLDAASAVRAEFARSSGPYGPLRP